MAAPTSTSSSEALREVSDRATPSALKRRVAVLFGYVAEGYHGLQYNFDTNTIYPTVEGELLKAFLRAGLIPPRVFFDDNSVTRLSDNKIRPNKMGKFKKDVIFNQKRNREEETRAATIPEDGEPTREYCEKDVPVPVCSKLVQTVVHWDRASRTDKGVHALKNVISLKMVFPRSLFPEDLLEGQTNEQVWEDDRVRRRAVEVVNEHLDSNIRVYHIEPVTASFNSHTMCTGRRYEYYCPSFAFMNRAEFITSTARGGDARASFTSFPDYITAELCESSRRVGGAVASPDSPSDSGAADEADEPEQGGGNEETSSRAQNRSFINSLQSIPPDVVQALSSYRIPAERLDRVRALFSLYVGTHSFHNFTPGKSTVTQSSHRQMLKLEVSVPEILPVKAKEEEGLADEARAARYPTGVEWLRIEITGQSFMLNQIRKMVGCVISCCLLDLPDAFLTDCLSRDVRRGVPMAPANGLFLVYLAFDKYNSRLMRIKNNGQDNNRKSTLDMDMEKDLSGASEKDTTSPAEGEGAAERIAMRTEVETMHRKILETIHRKETAEDITARWICNLRNYSRVAYGIPFGLNDAYGEDMPLEEIKKIIEKNRPLN